jgi:adenylate kinase family enzyme
MPVVRHYEKQRLVRTVNGVQPKEHVLAATRNLFQPQLVLVLGTVGSGRSELGVRAGRELSYATLHVTKILEAEVASASADGAVIKAAMDASRTVPTDVTISAIKRAIAATSAPRFLIDGFPRLVSAGFPGVHDQVFALEAGVGAVKGCIALDCEPDMRVARSGAKTPGELAALRARVDTYRREKLPVLSFFQKIGKACVIDTTKKTADEVFEAARPFLE